MSGTKAARRRGENATLDFGLFTTPIGHSGSHRPQQAKHHADIGHHGGEEEGEADEDERRDHPPDLLGRARRMHDVHVHAHVHTRTHIHKRIFIHRDTYTCRRGSGVCKLFTCTLHIHIYRHKHVHEDEHRDDPPDLPDMSMFSVLNIDMSGPCVNRPCVFCLNNYVGLRKGLTTEGLLSAK